MLIDKRIAAAMFVWVAGCGNQPVPQDSAVGQVITAVAPAVEQSQFSGFYTGTTTCETRWIQDGVQTFVGIESTTETKLFSVQGLPIVNGEELVPGALFYSEQGDLDVLERVATVTTFASGVQVTTSITIGDDDTVEHFTGDAEYNYILSIDGSINYQSSVLTQFTALPVSIEIECSGSLRQP